MEKSNPHKTGSSREVQGKKRTASDWGVIAEQLATRYLLVRGYTIRENNWKPKSGRSEIDIICEKNGEMVFVEVKARSSEEDDPVDAVDNKKMIQMVKGADSYLQGIDTPFYYRFDIIAITGNPEEYTIQHLEDAFISPLIPVKMKNET